MWRETGSNYLMISLFVIAFATLSSGGAYTAEVSLTASVDRATISIGEEVNLVLTVTTSLTSSLPEPSFGQMKDFEVTGKSTQSSSSISIINGEFTSQKSIRYSYSLMPRRVGDLVIPEAVVSHGGKEYRTDPITVKVLPSTKKRRATESGKRRARGEESPDIFIMTVANKESCYTEEAVVIEYSLYSQLTISELTSIELPGSGGFWWEEDSGYSDGKGRREIVNGNIYMVYPLKRFIVFPLSPGEKTIEPIQLGCRVRVRSRDFFDSFSIFGREKTVTVTGDEVSLTVLPVPQEGKPDGFTGAVGDFTIKAEADKRNLMLNEPLTLKVTIEGKGNFKTLGEPAVVAPDNVTIYPPDESMEVRFSGDNLSGKKVLEYILLPNTEGEFEIGGIDFSYFDPYRGKYVEKSTGKIHFSVAGKELPGVSSSRGLAEAMILGEDIRYIKSVPSNLENPEDHTGRREVFLLVNTISVLLFAGFLIRSKRLEKIQGSRTLKRQRYSGKNLKRTLKEAKKLLDHENHSLFVQKCEKAIIEYIGNRLDEETTGMTFRELSDLLISRQVDESMINLFSQWHEACQEARFSPGTMDGRGRKDLLKKTELLSQGLGEVL